MNALSVEVPEQKQLNSKMILEEETFKKFCYYPNDLSRGSKKKILASCNECGKVRETSKNAYRILCESCVRKKEHLSEETRQKLSESCSGKKKKIIILENAFQKNINKNCEKRIAEKRLTHMEIKLQTKQKEK